MGAQHLRPPSNGSVPIALADAALSRLFAMQFRLGMFDAPEAQPAWAKLGAEAVNTPANRETVLAAAAQGLVLLVNKKQTLPFSASKVKSLALVGPNVENIVTKDCGVRKEPSFLGCEGCYCANAVDPVSPRQGFAMHSQSVDYVAGCSTIMCDPKEMSSPNGWADAATAAGKADATVVIVGLDVTQECEGHDRENVTAPGGQNDFVKQVCDAAVAAGKPPCAVLVMAGSAVDTAAMEALPSVGALMWVGYPGERGGEAIANAVFGKSDEFGKMSFSVYKQEYFTNLSPLDFSMRPNASSHNPGRTYRFYNGPNMLHRFGTGLQYNSWTVDAGSVALTVRACNSGGGSSAASQCASVVPPLTTALVEASALEEDEVEVEEMDLGATTTTTVTVSARARHSGNFAHSSIPILVYAVPPAALVGVGGRPLRTLVGFERVEAAAGEAVDIAIEIPLRRMLLLAGAEGGAWGTEQGEWSIEVESGGGGHAGGMRQATIEVV